MACRSANRGTCQRVATAALGTFTALAVAAWGQAAPAQTPSEAARPALTAQTSHCGDLVGLHFGAAIVKSAVLMPATRKEPEYCRVVAYKAGNQIFEMTAFMPTQWDGELVHVGQGGMKGRIPNGDDIWNATTPLENGMIFLTGNGGNNDPTGSKLTDPEIFRDYAWRSLGTVFDFGQAVAKAYYSAAPRRNYFFGCSGGGAEALQAAMVFPEHYDGIVAQASPPSRINYIARTAPLNVLPRISEAKWDLIQSRYISECDGLDGVKDGIVSHQGACRFDPMTTPGLTPAEQQTVRFWFSDILNKDGTVRSRRMTFGPVGFEILSHHAEIWARTLFASDEPNYNPAAFDFEKYRPRIEFAVQRFGFDAEPAAVAGYLKRGGKLVFQMGLEDGTFAVADLSAFADAVRARAGTSAANMQTRWLPAVGHCGNRVVGTNRTQEQSHLNGADQVEMLGFMRSWVANGVAPIGPLIATRRRPDGTVQLSRPVCVGGSFPRYNGKGDPASAASFTCTPDPKAI